MVGLLQDYNSTMKLHTLHLYNCWHISVSKCFKSLFLFFCMALHSYMHTRLKFGEWSFGHKHTRGLFRGTLILCSSQFDSCIYMYQATCMKSSTDGLLHCEYVACQKRLACHLATKWQKPFSQVMEWMTIRTQFATFWAVDLCLRGTRRRIWCLGLQDGAAIRVDHRVVLC